MFLARKRVCGGQRYSGVKSPFATPFPTKNCNDLLMSRPVHDTWKNPYVFINATIYTGNSMRRVSSNDSMLLQERRLFKVTKPNDHARYVQIIHHP